jgi:[ribosomal protein S18]-alanine N-acetyltransferase
VAGLIPRAHRAMTVQPTLSISRLQSDDEAQTCALLMATSEPWITLGRSFETSLRIIQDPSREVYLVRDKGEIVGFVILCLTGAFVGYIQTICIHPNRRGQGLGSSWSSSSSSGS